jgi:hypothetical protein
MSVYTFLMNTNNEESIYQLVLNTREQGLRNLSKISLIGKIISSLI